MNLTTRSLILAILINAISGSLALGSVVQLTGGGSGNGLSLTSSSVVYAVYAGYVDNNLSTQSYTLQGVTFQTESSDYSNGFYVSGFPQSSGYNPATKSSLGNVLVDSHGGDSYSYNFTGSDAGNNTALTSILNGGIYDADATPLTVTLSGLTKNTNYTVDFLYSIAGGPTEVETLSLNGTLDDTISMQSSNPTAVYATTDTATANSSGDINVSFAEATGSSNPYPIFNALIVSSIVPEPCIIAPTVMTLYLVLRRRWK